MRRNLFLLLLLLITTNGFAQNRVFSNQFYFLSELKIENAGGKKFRYRADLKSVPQDSLSNIFIQTMQIGEDDSDYIQSNGLRKKPTDTLWHNNLLEQHINTKTKKIWLYVIQEGNGSFYVDNIKFEIQQADGSWTVLPVKNGDFEQEAKNPLKDYIKNKQLPVGTSISLSARENGRSLLIKASGGKSTFVTYYGKNAKAGNFCKVNGLKLYYETYGSGEPLLLLHGNGQSIAAFSKQIPALAEKYKVIAVDTRAQGQSTDTSTTQLSYEQFAADMKMLLDSLQLKKVNVLGWSDGGNTALIMASKYPEYVNKVMVMGANLNPSTAAVEESILKQAKKDLKKLTDKTDSEAKQNVRLLNLILNEPNISTNELEKITAQVLVMAGEKDLIKEQHTKLIANYIKGAQLKIFKGATHFIPQEDPATFNTTILEFLQHQSFF